MSKKLLITLRPADYYFFGGENTFDVDTVPGPTNYLVHSNLLPQQTALIGLLRHTLLLSGRKYGNISFQADWNHKENQEFGDLIGISPLFLQSGEGEARRFLLPAAKLWLAGGEEISIASNASIGEGFAGNTFAAVPKLEFFDKETSKKKAYSYKANRSDFWIDLETGKKIPAKSDKDQDQKGIFISSFHIGIDKMSRLKKRDADREVSDEEGFYKQEFYRLEKGYRFAIVAEVSDDVLVEVFKTTMPFGGESRTFCLDAEPWTGDLAQKWRPAAAYGDHSDRIVLTSDAFIEEPDILFGLCSFVAADARPFRNIEIRTSEYSKESFANLHRKKRQKLIYLLERGSVLFPKDGEEKNVVALLNQARNFQNIGYNHFHPHQSHL